jgi:AcrR family transcriptional regulator
MPDTYHHPDLRTALLAAAAAALTEAGPEALTMRALAARVGVSRTAAYRHFASKSDLLAGVAEEGFRRLAGILDAARQAADLDALVAQGVAYVRFAVEHPAHYQLMYGREALSRAEHAGLHTAAEAAYDALVGTLEEKQAGGLLRPADPLQLAYVVWSLLHGLASLLVDGQMEPPEDLDALARLSVRALLDGLAAPAA